MKQTVSWTNTDIFPSPQKQQTQYCPTNYLLRHSLSNFTSKNRSFESLPTLLRNLHTNQQNSKKILTHNQHTFYLFSQGSMYFGYSLLVFLKNVERIICPFFSLHLLLHYRFQIGLYFSNHQDDIISFVLNPTNF